MNIETIQQRFIEIGEVQESKVINLKYGVIIADFIDFCLAYINTLNEQELYICWQLIQNIAKSQSWNRQLQAGSLLTQLLTDNTKFKEIYSSEVIQYGYNLLSNDKREVRNIGGQIICCCEKSDIIQIFQQLQSDIKTKDNLFREAVATMCYNVFICDDEIIDMAIQILFDIAQINPLQKDLSLDNNYVFWYINRSITKILTISKHQFTQEQLDKIYQTTILGFQSNELKVRKSIGEALGCYYSQNQQTYNQMLSEIDKQIDIFNKIDKNQKQELNFETQSILLGFTSAIQILTGTHNWIKFNSQTIQDQIYQKLQTLYDLLPFNFTIKALDGSYQQALIKSLIPNQQQIKQLLQTDYLMSLEGGLDAAVYMQKYWQQSINELKYELLLCQNYPVQVISQLAMRVNHYEEFKVNDRCDLLSYNWQGIETKQLIEFIEQKLSSSNKDIIIASFNLLNNFVKDNSDKIEGINQNILDQITKYLQDYKEAQQLLSTLMENNKLTQQQQNSIQEQVEEIFLYLDDGSAHLIPYIVAQENKHLIQYIILSAFDIAGTLFSQISRQWLNVVIKYLDFEEFLSILQDLQESNTFVFNGISALIYYVQNVGKIDVDEQLFEFRDYMAENLDSLDYDEQMQEYFKSFIQYQQNNKDNNEIVEKELKERYNEEELQQIVDNQQVKVEDMVQLLKTSMELQPLQQIVLYGSLINYNQKIVQSEKMDIKYNNFVDFNAVL